MDPEILELKRKLYLLPEEFGLSHSRIWEMRTELRKLLDKKMIEIGDIPEHEVQL